MSATYNTKEIVVAKLTSAARLSNECVIANTPQAVNRAGRRLNRKYLHLLLRGKRSQLAVTAVSRELAGFIWGAMVGQVA